MSAPAPLSQRLQELIDNWEHPLSGYSYNKCARELREVLPVVVALEARAQGDKEIADRARETRASVLEEVRIKGNSSEFDGGYLCACRIILGIKPKIEGVGVVGEATEV